MRPGAPGRIGVLHPFPSLLDGIATGLIALLAGGTLPIALMAGTAMALLQTSIGATNDLCDIGHDRVARPQKALPSGLVAPRHVATYAVLASVAGLASRSISDGSRSRSARRGSPSGSPTTSG